jgi:hypothetical protein
VRGDRGDIGRIDIVVVIVLLVVGGIAGSIHGALARVREIACCEGRIRARRED